MALDIWLIYLVAVIGLSLTPGPNSLLALTHGALYGHRRSLFTISGGTLGFIIAIALSMFGIGMLLQASAHALMVLKWVGAAYLVWLGIQVWRSPPPQVEYVSELKWVSGTTLFRQGLLAAVSNPKVLLFFGAFLPQFLDPNAALLQQFVIMALTFALGEFFVEYGLARLAFTIRPWLARVGKRFNHVCGGLFIAIGSALPFTSN
ncbi:MAG: LysE family transporter [Saccharospirillum sp.]|uniref:LysE family translocator n=1 Tax=Saccharospirillum sp. TaxID=2033801 RepID=UPI003297C2AA